MTTMNNYVKNENNHDNFNFAGTAYHKFITTAGEEILLEVETFRCLIDAFNYAERFDRNVKYIGLTHKF